MKWLHKVIAPLGLLAALLLLQGNLILPNVRSMGDGDSLGAPYVALAVISSPAGTCSGSTVTWDPANKNALITLSNGNLTATNGSPFTWRSVKATLSKNAGKWYYAVSGISGVNGINFGWANATASTADAQYLGTDANGWGYYGANGQKVHNGGTAYGATFGAGDEVGAAYDADGGTITFYKNGVSQGLAFSSVSGALFPMLSLYDVSAVTTANFGASAFSYPIPSGYACIN